ncbi:recombinase family protein [Rhodococcus sp. NPDC058521]|uniref:recombinase family protein n=1 Tax=Rhodococcus sp. NPDC058521 TaxID=3346536 RepID=UPI003665CA65
MSKIQRKVMIGYVRVSTAEQAESRNGLEAQEVKLRAEAEHRGWELRIYRDEGASGKYVNEGLRNALGHLASGQADGLVVAKLDRLVRSVIHASEIIQTSLSQGWDLVILDPQVDMTTASGRLVANVMMAIAEFERELIGERTRDALAAKRRRNEPIGRKTLAEPWLIERIVAERQSGRSYQAIADDLMADEVLSPTGLRKWQSSTVRRIYDTTESKLARGAHTAATAIAKAGV